MSINCVIVFIIIIVTIHIIYIVFPTTLGGCCNTHLHCSPEVARWDKELARHQVAAEERSKARFGSPVAGPVPREQREMPTSSRKDGELFSYLRFLHFLLDGPLSPGCNSVTAEGRMTPIGIQSCVSPHAWGPWPARPLPSIPTPSVPWSPPPYWAPSRCRGWLSIGWSSP